MKDIMFYHDFSMFDEDIKAITEITWKHPIDWPHIRATIEEAIPLIDNIGPDGILRAIIREKEMRHINEQN